LGSRAVSAALTPSCVTLREVAILLDETAKGGIVDQVAWTYIGAGSKRSDGCGVLSTERRILNYVWLFEPLN
jgi:hypothetical protein